MAPNLASNPWSISAGDFTPASPVASPNGLALQTDGSVIATLGGNNPFGVATGQGLTLFNPTNAAYRGFYRLRQVIDPTHLNLVPSGFVIPVGTTASGGGTLAFCQWQWATRIEDISWQNSAAAGNLLIIVDRNGLPIWEATSTGAGSQNRGKVFWVEGFTMIQLDAGLVLVTVN